MSRLRQLPDVVAVAQVSVTMLDQRWTVPTRVAVDDSRPRDPLAPVHAWTVMASPELPSVVTLQTLEGALPAAALAPAGRSRC